MPKKKHGDHDSDEEDIFYYRYASYSASSAPSSNTTRTLKTHGGSGGLAPSKSTIYVSNLDFSLTNSDLNTLFSTFGKIARVTVLKDRVTRQSRGVAFIQYVSRDDAQKAAREMNRKVLNGRTLTASIAADNGRAPEFIKKRVYKDKSRCYECGEGGHLSYECPRNQLGPRQRPVPKRERHGSGGGGGGGYQRAEEDDDGSDGGDRFEDDNWASIVDNGADERLLTGNEKVVEKKKAKKASYFSDESGDEDD
ncbi:U11/U12 small nuclear ribonucleoprotein 31 kDa protein-like [Neltuma alba]|uniref:U11/U12 small nuclear ribonucleoprotein 31 kDa protein-like n=1 Tax=Neltuma alba TaxID=207710 RepID=UPI0010A4F23C|nr:U11/U12 small nuclear ribonucleoprotein 31 kDa protein-like [Prosopis alba]XP_028789615.1 U11/U12 small nuclear ribonucleoprotein 31 kDa protein-like [Prosopis alba]XP_028789626.1 U11/U12 small nuclear ribonucleoprotein 31 kDa protein-like [Prosopis alba]XP_028789632.1 U11/U12 small nuclear ribonucleoprotein 31 kDa protein-like [Prosopis alba]XP_028789638.1 U11/U12 small nuclear ribonucleoprotein 31 kDa protein-like [Prosopis alba]XP_028789644.1 U11/U12 small nuclear ribonucleoprotein 31 kD